MTDRAEPKTIVIAGAGGIGPATGLLLRHLGGRPLELRLGDRLEAKAAEAAEWVRTGSPESGGPITPFLLPTEGLPPELLEAVAGADLLLDCLPGSEAPRMAELARRTGLHYANLTEHVKETGEIRTLAEDAATSFVLQTGLAPGVIDVLGHGLFQEFCRRHGVERCDVLGLRVGGLPVNAMAPHFYAFTWSPIGVATEYLESSHVLEHGEFRMRRALEGVQTLILDGVRYEEAFTSGGVADLPTALSGRVGSLSYKTLRYPGHFDWVQRLVETLPEDGDRPRELLRRMREAVPEEAEDVVVLYAFVQGRDATGILRRMDTFRRIEPRTVGGHRLSAIQLTTAAGLAESARMLMDGKLPAGVVLQSRLDPFDFLSGPFVGPVYDCAEIFSS